MDFGAFGVMSEFHARYVSSNVPMMLPKPQVTAAAMPITNGARPTMMSNTEDGLSS